MTHRKHYGALVPCPFCATSRPVVARREQLGGAEFQYVTCTSCGARGPEHMVVSPLDQQNVIDDWNRRTKTERLNVLDVMLDCAVWIARAGDGERGEELEQARMAVADGINALHVAIASVERNDPNNTLLPNMRAARDKVS